jgi:hypothetical protein
MTVINSPIFCIAGPLFSLFLLNLCSPMFFMPIELQTELEYFTILTLQIYLYSHFNFLMDSSQCLGTKSLSLLTFTLVFLYFFYLLSQFYSLVALFCQVAYKIFFQVQ